MINLIKGKEISIEIQSKYLKCVVRGKQLFEGELFDIVSIDESIWSLEDRKLIRIQLVKSRKKGKYVKFY